MTVEKAIEILSDVGDINRCCAEDAEALDMAIKALEQQPCEDCISRQEAISAIQDEYYAHAVGIDIVDIIAHLPPVQPTRPTARWERLVDDFKKCSKCGKPVKFYRNYKHCPGCGARMIESEEER